MTRIDPVQGLAAGATVTTVALTGTAFWLSYSHLADIAEANGLDGARAWAWPGTVDAFIGVGELLILRAALRGRFDWFAYLLAAVGSLGSIALNVLGVGAGAQPMEYVVAAVPPVAALLAFAAVMRQVHERLAGHVEHAEKDTPAVVTAPLVTPPLSAPEVTAEVTLTEAPERPALAPAPSVEPLVICGDREAWPLVVTPRDTGEEVSDEVSERLPADAALAVIEKCHVRGTSVAEAARVSTRSTSYVKKVFGRLDDARGPQPMPGQLALVAEEVSA